MENDIKLLSKAWNAIVSMQDHGDAPMAGHLIMADRALRAAINRLQELQREKGTKR